MKIVLFGLSLAALAVLYRVIPHTSNVTPFAALALLAVSQGFRVMSGWALFLPILVLLVSDLFLGFYPGVEFVYGGHLLAALMGLLLTRWSMPRFVGAVGGSALIFFAVSNLGVWLMTPLYAKTWSGLVECYVAALPFLKMSLLGDFVFASLVFGAYRLGGLAAASKERVCEDSSL